MRNEDITVFRDAGRIIDSSGVVDQSNVEAALMFFSLYQDLYIFFMDEVSQAHVALTQSYSAFLKETFSLTIKEVGKSGKLSSVTITMRIFFSFMRMPISDPLEEAINAQESSLEERIAEMGYLICKIVDMDGRFPYLCRVLMDYKSQLNHINRMLTGMYGHRETMRARKEMRTHLISNLKDFRKATLSGISLSQILREETKRWIGVLAEENEFDMLAFRNPYIVRFFESLDPAQKNMYAFDLLYMLAGYQENDPDWEKPTTAELAKKLGISSFSCFFKKMSFRSKYRKWQTQAEEAQWLTQPFEEEEELTFADEPQKGETQAKSDEVPEQDSELQVENGEAANQNSDLQAENGEAAEQDSELQAENGEAAEQNSELQVENGEAAEQNSELQLKNGEAPEQNSELQAKNDEISEQTAG